MQDDVIIDFYNDYDSDSMSAESPPTPPKRAPLLPISPNAWLWSHPCTREWVIMIWALFRNVGLDHNIRRLFFLRFAYILGMNVVWARWLAWRKELESVLGTEWIGKIGHRTLERKMRQNHFPLDTIRQCSFFLRTPEISYWPIRDYYWVFQQGNVLRTPPVVVHSRTLTEAERFEEDVTKKARYIVQDAEGHWIEGPPHLHGDFLLIP